MNRLAEVVLERLDGIKRFLDNLESSMLFIEKEVSHQGQRLSVLEQRISSIESGYVSLGSASGP